MDVDAVIKYLQVTQQDLSWITPPNLSGRRYVAYEIYGTFRISGFNRSCPLSRIIDQGVDRLNRFVPVPEQKRIIQASSAVTDFFDLTSNRNTKLGRISRQELEFDVSTHPV